MYKARETSKLAAESVRRLLYLRNTKARRDRNGSAPTDDLPFHEELLSISQLEQRAKTLALGHELASDDRSRHRLLERLGENEDVLREAYATVTNAVSLKRKITPAAEWFLDNYHLIEDQIRTARRHLPRGYSRDLPLLLIDSDSTGDPRVYDIALDLISHADGRVDAQSLRAFVSAYQSIKPLQLGELWAIPIMLRLALVENLRRVAARVSAGRRDREEAGTWVDRMISVSVSDPSRVVLVLADLVKREPVLSDAFVAEFASRLQGQAPSLIFAMTWIEQRLVEQGQTLELVYQRISQAQAADQLSIGNSIGSLRFLGATDWREFVESMSIVEQELHQDPTDVYPKMDFATRDRYRHVVEDIARLSHLSEIEVARSAVTLARRLAESPSSEADAREAHVGYFLIDKGRIELEQTARMHVKIGLQTRRWFKSYPLATYLSVIFALCIVITCLFAGWASVHGVPIAAVIATVVLLLVATSQLAIDLVQWAATLLIRPALLPRLDFSKGIDPVHQTVVAVPAMLSDAQEIDDLLETMEVRFLANRDSHLSFALLTDFPDALTETTDGDAALVQRASDGIRELNAKYASLIDPSRAGVADAGSMALDATVEASAGFFLFHRARKLNASDGTWMGWERKRGKLEQFNEALRGDVSGFKTIVGPVERLQSARYVITLDSDTQLPRESAAMLVGTMAHPLNCPRFDETCNRVVEGYGILQPRVGISMPSAAQSGFASLFAGEPGIDPYTRAVSDVYQDVFQEGSFIGKGIYDIDALQKTIGGQFPENHILSHDLLEGAYARSGLVSDVTLFEDFPSSYTADVARRHRWIRGDWQIAPWLLTNTPGCNAERVPNRLSWLSRWKLFDNIRRSVVRIAILGLLLLGWFLPGVAVAYTIAGLAILLLPTLLASAAEFLRRSADVPFIDHTRHTGRALVRQLARDGFGLATIPFDAFASIDAISRTIVRLYVTGKKLLQWRTARDAQRAARDHLDGFYISMWIQPTVAIVTLIALMLWRQSSITVASPILLLWMLAPGFAWWLSRPVHAVTVSLPADQTRFLHSVARRTWRYFEAFVTADDNFLPPDNYQEDPPQGIAHRTSPTNIGLALLANLNAYDFGYVTQVELLDRTNQTLESTERLQRYRGHLYNWYDTQTLEPLRPLYISTVDSGNLAGHLLTLASGLKLLDRDQLARPAVFVGIAHVVEVLRAVFKNSTSAPRHTSELKSQLASIHDVLQRDLPRTLSESAARLKNLQGLSAALAIAAATSPDLEVIWWTNALDQDIRKKLEDLLFLAPWLDFSPPPEPLVRTAPASPRHEPASVDELMKRVDEISTYGEAASRELAFLPAIDSLTAAQQSETGEAATWLRDLRERIALGASRAAERLSLAQSLATRCTELADLDYEFLYDRQRHLLAIGYNVADQRLDASFYDLLASEARLASFVAIAQGKLPQEHWFSLGRLLTSTGGRPSLLSWSGSMFEYLMPLLVMPTFEETLLDQTYHAVVDRQIEYGKERGVPWGVSESGYIKTDAHLNYQYRAFGVPGLGFKRGLADDVVIAPYASAMALMVDPEAATANLLRLDDDGRMGAYGFYEAVDYTASRMPRGEQSVTVSSYMVHHQGMAFLSLGYLLLNRPMQRRFEADPSFRATQLLLQERVPRAAAVYPHPAEVTAARDASADQELHYRAFNTPHTAVPEVHLLSNSRYHVMMSAAGGGYSRWRDLAITRWHEDATRDPWGSFCYLRDVETDKVWSTTFQPTLKNSSNYEAIYSQGRAEYRRRDEGIESHLEVSVSPEDDIELRRVTLTNRSETTRTIELTTYAEVVLATAAADAAHPAFSKLFVQTELLRDKQAIICTRRPRSEGERPAWMMHSMVVFGRVQGEPSYETDRAKFIGREGSIADPAALHRERLEDSEGSVLDPIVSIRSAIVIEPGESAYVHLVTGVAETRDGVLAQIEKYNDRHLADRVFELAWTQSLVLLGQLDATEAETQLYGRLASHILYANRLLRAPGSVIARNRRGQSGLWGYSISGDLPILMLRIADSQHIAIVRQLVQAHSYWRSKGLQADLVILNEDQSGYRQVLHEQILSMIASRGDGNLMDRPGGIFVRRSDQLSEEDKVLMQTVARVIIVDTAGSLVEQIERRMRTDVPIPKFTPLRKAKADVPTAVEIRRPDLRSFNGIGGFTSDGREYVITTTPEIRTPAPWVNVIANPWFGTVVSENGSAYTWCENAHAYRLTPWNNDPVSDTGGEHIYLRDEESGYFWSPSPFPARGPMPYSARHGFGYSIFEYVEDGIFSEMWTYVAVDAPLKFVVIKLRNASGRTRRLSATACFELVMGTHRAVNAPYVVTEVDPKSGAVLIRNTFNTEFAERIAFLDCSETQRNVTGDRLEFFGRNGGVSNPAAMSRARLSGRVGAGVDPCAAMQSVIELADGQEREIVFTFGSGRDLADARNLVARFRGSVAARQALEQVWHQWNRILGAVHVETPDESLNFLANGWLLYQVLACRMWARSGFYQSGGAFGFRDQLQDAMSLAHAEPGILRDQLLKSAAHQFVEGDVQHWWHPPIGRGVRTRISDDYLWLPYAACRYVTAVGDTGVLDEKISFLDGRRVRADEESYYDLPGRSDITATLYDHCVRAIRNGLHFGSHGLPLMGCGDWNDGMNLVGEHGQGESVWLGFFLYDVLIKFGDLATRRGDLAFADECKAQAALLQTNVEAHAWDGDWYRRAYFDDGTPLGSAQNTECRIDSLPQSWSMMTQLGDRERSQHALKAIDELLVRRDVNVIQLFDPPFDKSHMNPGYIKGYVPGVRENGGQYTHAAVWSVMAFAAAGDAQKAWELFNLINPIRHGDSEASLKTYKVEPYVMAADVYTNPQHEGRGGWTWYTGSAGWMYRLVVESLLGLHLDVDRLRVTPLLPPDWPSFRMHYRYRDTFHHIEVRRIGEGNLVTRVTADGVEQPDMSIPLRDDGQDHHAEVEIGSHA